jgi:glycosyltransferase involved in cell wall biosynthesis
MFGHTEVFGLSKSLIKKGHEVIVVGASTQKTRHDGHIIYVKNPFKRRTLFQMKLALYLPWLVASRKPDFIVMEWQSAFVPIILLLLIKLRLYRNTLVHDLRTIPVNDFDPRRLRLFSMCLKMSKKHYRGITTITNELKKKICSEYDIAPAKVGVWSSGVDDDLFYPRNGELKKKALGLTGKFIVFYHGSVGYRRGVVEVVKALGLLKNKYPDICLFILGSGLETETIQKIISDEKLDNVYLHLPVSYNEVPDYIAMADVCIVPLPDIECWRVSSPLKIMEYLAMGKPIILTDIIAHREIIKSDSDALYIPDIQPQAISHAIEKAYSMEEELTSLGEVGRHAARRQCSWDKQAERFIAYLESLE